MHLFIKLYLLGNCYNHKQMNFFELKKSRVKYLLGFIFAAVLVASIFSSLLQPRISGILIYIKLHTDQSGKYDYEYYPKEDFVGYTEHLIRHTATTYALADYLLTKPAFLSYLFKEDLQNSLTYTLTQKQPCLSSTATCIHFVYDQPTLGANAFTIMALGKVRQLTVIDQETRDGYLAEMVQLEEYLAESFKNNELVFAPKVDETSQRYETGQVLLAWISLYEATKDSTYLEKATSLLNGTVANLNLNEDYQLHHWLWLGLKDYYKITEENLSPEVTKYVIKSAEELLNSQISDTENANYGTFTETDTTPASDTTDEGTHPRETSSQSVKIEGLGSLLFLISKDEKTCQSSDLCQRLKNGIASGIPILDGEQINILKILNEYSLNSFGGFPLHRKNNVIQIDNLQHALAAYQVFNTQGK
jgi:hypothetical protein